MNSSYYHNRVLNIGPYEIWFFFPKFSFIFFQMQFFSFQIFLESFLIVKFFFKINKKHV